MISKRDKLQQLIQLAKSAAENPNLPSGHAESCQKIYKHLLKNADNQPFLNSMSTDELQQVEDQLTPYAEFAAN